MIVLLGWHVPFVVAYLLFSLIFVLAGWSFGRR